MSALDAVGAIAPGRLAVVTRAASGTGLVAARAFAAKGMRVALVDRTGDALEAAAAGPKGATAYALDVADSDAPVKLAKELGEPPPPPSS